MYSLYSLYSRMSFYPAVCLHEILITWVFLFFFTIYTLLLPTPTKPDLDTVVYVFAHIFWCNLIIATFGIYG